ncbi:MULTISPECIES: helix-turn-helix domain-containing protein [Mycobacterium]|uniref:IclR family transcriptional regulator n=1 Tax=Mycobacterium gordonae TaxID=1778 RepID=A0A1A6BMY7_MYCGO|nr:MULTISPECIES: helix-turn-helix domain-containing protein [Mycobacterium]MCV7007862.1 helix-turn-helix domain-containing protein [Mycobacterium gordonae]OBS03666.1 IclR family transcriptional regulator [Mycobacterium gordonae]ODR19247.1 IclR family transcriptional regulator [Mycobacterium gordonae]ORV88119.1 IclR family transcriptional regulator [Mycobacterium gordonae]PJE06630.1 MAG: IclR family transcriptional regulator [Mycobacterium sp.]
MTATLDGCAPQRQPASPPTERVVAIMELLASQPTRGFTLAEISRELGISRATGHAIMSTLAGRQWVVRAATGAYTWGPGIASLSTPAPELRHHGILQSLAESIGAQVFLARRESNSIVVIDSAGETASGVHVERGLRMPLVAPFGRDYIAWSSTAAQRSWLAGMGKPTTAMSRRMSLILNEIRERGYVIERLSREYIRVYTALRALGADGEPDAITVRLARALADLTVIDILAAEFAEAGLHNIATISAPVFDADGVVIMSVSAAPFTELSGAQVADLGDKVCAAARDIGCPR